MKQRRITNTERKIANKICRDSDEKAIERREGCEERKRCPAVKTIVGSID